MASPSFSFSTPPRLTGSVLQKTAAVWVALVVLSAPCFAAPENGEYAKAIVVTPLLKTSTTASGQAIEYPKTTSPEVRVLLVEIPPGAETGWHKHPMPCYAYILSGSVTVELENGKRTTFGAGQAFAETVNTLHNGRNTGTTPVRIVMTATSEKGAPTTEAVKRETVK